MNTNKASCKYCDPKLYMVVFNRLKMCRDCQDEYDYHLERKMDEEKDERLISKMEQDEGLE